MLMPDVDSVDARDSRRPDVKSSPVADDGALALAVPEKPLASKPLELAVPAESTPLVSHATSHVEAHAHSSPRHEQHPTQVAGVHECGG
eukprot:3773973-Rhodomonas_salina.1